MIQINDKLRIRRFDDKNFVVEQLRDVENLKTKTTTKKWIWCGYYGDVKTALVGVLHKCLFDSEEEKLELKDILNKIESVVNDIKNMEIIEE